MARNWWESAPLAEDKESNWWESAPLAEAPREAEPIDYSDAATAMQGTPAPAAEEGLISRIGRALRPEYRSVMENYQPSPEQVAAERDRRLSYGAGPIRSEVVSAADEVRSRKAKSDNPTVNRVAKAMEDQGQPSFTDLLGRAADPENQRAARLAKAEEFRTPGEWAIDTISALAQGGTSLVQLPVNIIAPSSSLADSLRKTQKEWRAQESDVLQAQRDSLRERIQNEDGFFDKYVATVSELVTNPALGLSEAIKQVPMFIGVLGGAKLGAAAFGGAVNLASKASPTLALGEAISGNAIRAGAQAAGSTAGGVAASAVMAGGDAAGAVYERLTDPKQTGLDVWKQNPDYQKLVAEGKSSKEAIEEIATAKARLAAAITAPLGVFGYMGAEASIAARGLAGAAAQVASPRRAAQTFGKEVVGEQVEEGGTQFGGNVITRTVDPNQNLLEGVPEAMGTALVTSSPFAALGAANELRGPAPAPFDPLVDTTARTLLDPQSYDAATISPRATTRDYSDIGPSAPITGQLTSDPTTIVSTVRNATSVDEAITAAEQSAGSLDLNLPPPLPIPRTGNLLGPTAEPVTPPMPPMPALLQPTPAVDPMVEQEFGLDKLRLDFGVPQGILAPRPQRIQGRDVAAIADDELEQIVGNDTLPAITRRGASVELAARRAETQPPTAAPGATVGANRVEPTLDSSQPAAGAFELPGRVEPTVTGNFLSLPDDAGVRDLSVAPVGGEAAARSARQNAQRALDNYAAKTGAPVSAQLNAASPELDSAVNEIARAVNSQFAGRIYAYSDPRPEAVNGLAIGRVAFVNTANVDTNVARTSLHEFKHTVEQIAKAESRQGLTDTPAQRFTAQIDSIFDDMSDEGKRAYVSNFLAKDELNGIADPAARETRLQELVSSPLTRSEMTADFLGNRATDKQFWKDVEQADPQGFKGFVQKWLGVIDNLLAQLRGTSSQGRKESAKVDQYIRDLNKAKMVAREALVAYSKSTRQEPVATFGQSAEVQASARESVPVVRIDPGKKKIDERFPELMAAADKVASGEMTPVEYGQMANSPEYLGSIAPYDFVPSPATDEEAINALTSNKRPAWNATNNLQAGERVGLRLDIPAYKDHGVWVNSIHPEGKPTAYSAVSAITDAVFPDAGSKALGVAQGKAKAPFARIEGRWSPVKPEQAVARMQEVFNDPQWTQVGYNPLRHSYFFDRKTGNPVTAAEEVIQIGPLVLAKNATIEEPDALNEDGSRKFMYSKRQSDSPVLRGGVAEEVGDFNIRTQKDGTLGVAGDVEAIRALLPEGIKGRAVPGGLMFTTSDAPRVKAALEGRKIAYSRAGQVIEKLPMKNGKYVGAPEKYNTPAKIATLRKNLRKLTLEGERGRYWYENSSREVLQMVGGNVQEARKFVALLSIYSPQAKVDANSTFALRAWAQYRAGQKISVKTGVQDNKATAALDDVDAFWSGEKTGNFFTNLLREIDPTLAQGATIDMWMMRAAEYNNDAPTATQYAFMENETNRLAQELGWEPQQVQAAIWVAMKARMENAGVKKRTEASSEKKGWIRYDYPLKNGRPVKTRVILNAQAHRDNWLKHAFDHTPTKDDTEQAKFDFSDGLRRHIGQLSWEARPGRSTNVLPGVNDAPYEQQVEFQQAVQKALLDDDGVDLLAYKLGLLVDGPDILAPGIWQGEVAAGMQKLVAMAPAKGDDGKTSVDPAQKKAVETYAAMLGLLLRQEGVGYHRPFYKGKKADENAVNLDIGRTFTPAEAQALWGAIDERMRVAGVTQWENGAGMISSPTGMRVVNFGALPDNTKFKNLVDDAATTLAVDEVKSQYFSTDGDLVFNDWKENPNGESYQARIREAYGPDLLDWARDVLAPRVQSVFDEFSSRYGWGDAGRVDALFEPAAEAEQQQEVTTPEAPAEEPPALSRRQRKADEVPRDELAGRKLRIPVLVEETGQTATITMDAKAALDDVDEREAAMRRLLECLRK